MNYVNQWVIKILECKPLGLQVKLPARPGKLYTPEVFYASAKGYDDALSSLASGIPILEASKILECKPLGLPVKLPARPGKLYIPEVFYASAKGNADMLPCSTSGISILEASK